MNNLETLHQQKKTDGSLAESLQIVLGNTYGLYLETHNYHWNVEGNNFFPLHKLFEDQYNSLFEAIDVIAERIRALECYALPFEGDEILTMLKTTSNALNKETDSSARNTRMIHNLIDINEKVIMSCQSTKGEAQHMGDDETENLMVERITYHQKALWMLKSTVKQVG
jgi:starvation-inducible DNA-binding protein